ncbi:DNA polymerase III subunit delta' [Hylemonella gracilis]|uniref:DNA polymerase III subunit delta n=2 Tax=Hylemonella gracilis TaxID=80880 RepID=A0A4P6UQV6_9BURK|nr:DNA polymerase III subunit delta' [Hylemonella gracilis]
MRDEASAASTMPPWIARQSQTLAARPGHAWLLQGPSGLGQYGLALALARAWLCESPLASSAAPENGPGGGWSACGHCPSCHAIDVHTHADLCVLMPETVMLELGWPLSEKAQGEIDKKERKPSKEIRVDAMRDAIEFAQRTSARGRGKVMLIYPAERMNAITANALLKTLEEPPGELAADRAEGLFGDAAAPPAVPSTRFVLATEAAHQLLPTIRSRCMSHVMAWPTPDEALAWLRTQGMTDPDAQVWLRAAGGRPEDAVRLATLVGEPARWQGFPRAMQRGELAGVAEWSPPQLIDALYRLCHDLMSQRVGAAPRYFDAADLPPLKATAAGQAAFGPLRDWQRELAQEARTAEHPYNPGLMMEALVSRASRVLQS